MYGYDQIDKSIVQARVEQFRDQTLRFLNGKLSEDEFRPLRLQNGLYIQRHSPMLRIELPYGQVNAEQLDKLAGIVQRYDRGFGHLTTRNNVQLNWVNLAEVPDILAELAEVELHAIQTSGNVVRNITTDQFAGIAADEVVDPRPYAEILRQWSTFHPEFAYLPRKFKIAITGAKEDRTALLAHDLGLRLVKRDDQIGFQVFAGGGLGRTPILAVEVKDFLPWQHLLTYIEAILRVFNRYGRRDKAFKARIKILVQALGQDEFARQVEEEWQHEKDSPQTLTEQELERVAAHFAPPPYAQLAADDFCNAYFLREDKAFARWTKTNVHAHKIAGYAAVTLSLKAKGVDTGDISASQFEAVADLARRYSFGQVRSSHKQNLVLPDVQISELYTVWHLAKNAGLATPTAGLLTDVIACPGGDYCALANARSQPIADAIRQRFDDLDYLHDLGELNLNISGCMNGCGHNALGHIGIIGVDKNDSEWYQISVGGSPGYGASHETYIGKVLGPAIPASSVIDVIERLLSTYVDLRQQDELFIEAVARLGYQPFVDAAYQNTEVVERKLRYA